MNILAVSVSLHNIGETQRYLISRICQHKGTSPRTSMSFSNPPFKASTHETHFTRISAWGAGEQLIITANHHHEDAPLTTALMSGKRYFGLIFLRASLAGLPK